jgi:hypothetical protein
MNPRSHGTHGTNGNMTPWFANHTKEDNDPYANYAGLTRLNLLTKPAPLLFLQATQKKLDPKGNDYAISQA